MSSISSIGLRKIGDPELYKQVKMNLDSSLVLTADVPRRFFCVFCGNLVIPDYTMQTSSGDLMCGVCSYCSNGCSDQLALSEFAKSDEGRKLQQQVGKVFVRCEWYKNGCKWIGTFSDHAAHTAFCLRGVAEFEHQNQRAINQTVTTKEMAERYENAYFLWSWLGEMVGGEPVLSNIRVSSKGMCAFVSITAALEASLRLKGYKVKHLSIDVLYKQYLQATTGPNALRGGTLKILATILKEEGMVELSSDGGILKRWYISKFERFKMNTEAGMLGAIGHMRDHGPVVCVHAVRDYQSRNKKSRGIIHDNAQGFVEKHGTRTMTMNFPTTHAVCSVGFGVEDMTSFLHYQNTKGVAVQKDGYGRILPCSVLEALGLVVEDYERPLKRPRQASKFRSA